MLTFDTTEATADKQVKIDGTVYTIQPLGGASFMKIMQHRSTIDKISAGKLSGAQMVEAQDELFGIIRPLITPSDEFVEWEKHVRAKNEVVYWQIMSEILKLVMSGVNAKVSK